MKRRQSLLNRITPLLKPACGLVSSSREGLKALVLCFLVNTFAQLKVKSGKWKIISCHSEDEIRRISISWETNANPCDSSLRSERQVLCHTALDAVSHKYSAFTSSPCDRGSESAMTIPILPLELGATHVENLQAGKAV